MDRLSRRSCLRWRSILVLVVLLALVVRAIAYAADPKPAYLAGLTAYQAEMARNILDHRKWFVVNQKALDLLQHRQNQQGRLLDPTEVSFSRVDRDARYKPEILEMPGLVLPLAGLWWAAGSERYSYIRWVQIVLDTAMVLLVYWITLRLTQRRRVAIAASLLYALWPGAIVLAKTPSLDTWAGFFVISALALFLLARASRWRILKLTLLGALIGLGIYFRPFLILLPVAFAVAEVKRTSWRRTVESALVPTVIAMAFVAPWAARNLSEFNRFIPTRIGIGQALWEGLGETPNSFGAVNDDGAAIRFVHARRPDLEYPSPAFDDFLLRRAAHAIVDHPLHYIELLARRALFLVPCLLAFVWRRRAAEHALLVAVAVAVILPYVFVRMETRFWLPAAFAYLILFATTLDAIVRTFRHAAPTTAVRGPGEDE